MKKLLSIKKIIKSKEFKKLYDIGLVDEIALRNAVIKEDYEKKKIGSNYKIVDIQQEIADKYNMSVATLKKIIYSKRNIKKIGIVDALLKSNN